MTKKKPKLKTQNIIIFANIIILLGIIFFYTYRLVHFYRIEHPKIEKSLTLNEIITLKKNIVTFGSGLYKVKDGYIYKGNDINNYLEYSGYLFRVLSIDKDGNIKVITDDSLTNLAWGLEDSYENSYVKSWLDGQDEHAGIFYKSLNDPTKYLVDTNFCTKTMDLDEDKCNLDTTSKVGLLSLKEYQDALGKDSFLVNNGYFWLANPSSEGVWYVYNQGLLDDDNRSGKNHYSYGVRPVITLKGNLKIISGDGSKDNPYRIESNTQNVLKYKNVGSYIKYSDLTWRIIEKNDNYIRVCLDGLIKDGENIYERQFSGYSNIYSTDDGIGYYLNTTFYNTLDKTYLKDGKVYTNRYDSTVDFNYLNIFTSSINAKVGMLQAGDLFMNDYSNYFLASRTSTYVGTIYKVMDESTLYADLVTSKAYVRPTIFLDTASPIKLGDGTKNNPYLIEGE